MKNSQSLPLLTHSPSINYQLQQTNHPILLNIKQDKYYQKPHLSRITYFPIPEKKQKENTNRIMLQSCISNRKYEQVWDDDNETKIRKQLGPSQDSSRRILDPLPLSYIGKDAPLKHYKQYKRLQKTLLRKDFHIQAISLNNSSIKQPASYDSPSVSLLQKSESLQVLPLCLGLVKCKGENSILNLTNYNLGDRYIIALAAGLSKATKIQKCLLGANRITDLGLCQLARAIHPELLVLDLSQNKITQIDNKLLQIMSDSDFKLQEINLANNLLKTFTAQAIFKNIAQSKHIINLNLNKNRLGIACIDSLVQMIEKSTTLEHLYIGTNYLSGKAGQRIFNLLANNKTLKVLDYSLNQLGDNDQLTCAKAIANCFTNNKSLKHVDISFNNFGKQATKTIAEGLEPNKSIYGIHYRGNYGWINSKGFLKIEEKEETLLDSIEQQKMKGFEITVIRQNHSLKSEPLKNVCWICQGWHEQQFRLSLQPKSQGKMLVYIHFDFQQYEPRLISQNELHVRYITMVPPKKYRYFFTHNKEILYDTGAKSQQLPIPQTFSYEIENSLQEFNIKEVSFRISKAKKIVNDANEIIIKTHPRFNGIVTRKVKIPWSYNNSVWAKQWKLDDDDLLKKCFERDWKQSKIMNLIKNQADQDKVRSILLSNYSNIKAIYKQFASWSPFGDVWAVSSQPFTEFCQQAKIINKDTPLKIIDLTFITTNSMSGSDWKGNALVPERGLVRFQFMESLVRLAEQKFKKNGIFDNFADSVEVILRDHLQLLVPLYNANQWRLQKYLNQYNDALIKYYRPIFTAIYKRNSRLKCRPGQKGFMCLAEFKSILERSGVMSYLSERDIFVSFNCSMMTQVDELQSQRFTKMTQIQFIEAVARISNTLPKQCCVQPDDYAPLHMKFQWLIQQLKPLCPQDVRSQFPEISISMFRAMQQQQNQ